MKAGGLGAPTLALALRALSACEELPDPAAQPLPAVVVGDWVNVRASPSPQARVVGLLERGAVVELTRCTPDCAAADGWAEVGGGWASLALLRPDRLARPAPERPLLHGAARRESVPVLAAPDAGAPVQERLQAPRTLALYEDPALLAQGWLERAGGGYVAAGDVSLDTPSLFEGAARPTAPLAFLLRDAPLRGPDGGTQLAAAGSRFELLALSEQEVATAAGTLARSAVRVALPRARPLQVPDGARWLHVDTREQVLTAYEGDTWVYATLVSTGLKDSPTLPGLYTVWMKTLHERMHGDGYYVEEVPDILYFHGSQGLHAAFWHDGFGRARSHGCVNLAPADARWVFNWAPPVLPQGWHTRRPAPEDASLFVWISP